MVRFASWILARTCRNYLRCYSKVQNTRLFVLIKGYCTYLSVVFNIICEALARLHPFTITLCNVNTKNVSNLTADLIQPNYPDNRYVHLADHDHRKNLYTNYTLVVFSISGLFFCCIVLYLFFWLSRWVFPDDPGRTIFLVFVILCRNKNPVALSTTKRAPWLNRHLCEPNISYK